MDFAATRSTVFTTSPFCRITVEEIEAERLSDDPSETEVALALEKEGQKLIKKLIGDL